MRSMEQLLRESIEKAGHPQTLSELMVDLPERTSASEVEESLENLVKRGEIVCKSVSFNGGSGSGEGGSCTLYWRTDLSDKSSEFVTPAKPSSLLTRPRSGIRPPSVRARLPFKSPARLGDTKPLSQHTPSPSSVKTTPRTSLGDLHVRADKSVIKRDSRQLTSDASELRARLEEVEGQINELTEDGCREDELQSHIDALHEYNEVKDVGQLLLGKIAELEGTTTTSLYERFGLDLDN